MQLTDIMDYYGLVFFSLFLFSLVLNFPVLIAMHLLMPDEVLKRYFKPPYFNEAEVVLFTGLPYCMVRTVMFMGVFAFPHRGKKRRLTQAYVIAPLWYRWLSMFYVVALFVTMVSFVSVGFVGCIYFTYTGQMEWW